MNQKMKKLLILGANAETIPIVQKAKQMGIYTIIIDYIHGSPAKKIADKYYDVDGKDVDALKQIIIHDNVDGVLLGVADALMYTYVLLCESFNFPCYIAEESIAFFQNKKVFKEKCEKVGVHTIKTNFVADDYDKIDTLSIQYPVVIKPVIGRGGRGISLCKNKRELRNHFDHAQNYSDNRFVLGEQYMNNEDVVATFMFEEEKMILLGMSDRIMRKGTTALKTVTYSNIYPSKWTEHFLKTSFYKFEKLYQNVGIKEGIVNIQMFVKDGVFYPYDLDCILNGEVASDVFLAAYNTDIMKSMIEYSLSGKMKLSKENLNRNTKVAMSVWIQLTAGKISIIKGKNLVENSENVVGYIWRFSEGDVVTEDMLDTEKGTFARIWVCAGSREKLLKKALWIRNTLEIYDEFGNDMMQKEFFH